MDVAIIGPEGGDAIQLGPILMRILEDGSTTGHRLGVGEITLPPHTDGPPQHRHARHDEGFYVVSRAPPASRSETRPMTLPPARWSWSRLALRTPSPTLAMSRGTAQHVHARPLRSVLPGPPRHDRRRSALHARSDCRGHGPLRHGPRHRLRRLTAEHPVGQNLRQRGVTEGRDTRSTNMTTTAVSTTRTINVAGIGPVELTVEERGDGRPFLVLHGGAGPQSVAAFAQLLAEKGHNRVLTPIHPGFGGTPRPEGLDSVAGLAALYAQLARRPRTRRRDRHRELRRRLDRRRDGPAGHHRASAASCSSMRWVSRWTATRSPTSPACPCPRSRHCRSTTRRRSVSIPPPSPMPRRRSWPPTAQPWPSMPALRRWPTRRCSAASSGIAIPTLVLWGESDRIVEPAYGQAYAAAIPGARFEVLPATGHMPQMETPDLVLAALAVE